jgi:hypothetical protein
MSISLNGEIIRLYAYSTKPDQFELVAQSEVPNGGEGHFRTPELGFKWPFDFGILLWPHAYMPSGLLAQIQKSSQAVHSAGGL